MSLTFRKGFAFFCLATMNVFAGRAQSPDTLHYADEKYFKNIHQLTFGGDNAEAYLSYDDKQVIFQRTNPKEGLLCDKMFIGKIPATMNDSFTYKMVNNHKDEKQ